MTYKINKEKRNLLTVNNLSKHTKAKIEEGVKKVIKDYGETLKMLGKE